MTKTPLPGKLGLIAVAAILGVLCLALKSGLAPVDVPVAAHEPPAPAPVTPRAVPWGHDEVPARADRPRGRPFIDATTPSYTKPLATMRELPRPVARATPPVVPPRYSDAWPANVRRPSP